MSGVFRLFGEEVTFGFRFFALAMSASGACAGGVFRFFEKELTSSFRLSILVVVTAGARTCGVFLTFNEALALKARLFTFAGKSSSLELLSNE